ncbi:MAG: hypothetical protein C4K60_07780 [Ideonella sp. MAG2]|nr:MAG: hypothetical protein C4K60_07780 [Ideonella sp. MAG2]
MTPTQHPEPSGSVGVAEALSQMSFLASVMRAQAPLHLPTGLAALPGPRAQAQALSGLRAYRANGLAVAHRALVAAYPTVAAMVGDEAMKVLARDLWWQSPPVVGDLALWGEALPDWLGHFEPLAEFPWLPDCARLDWVVHRAATLADVPSGRADLHLLAEVDPEHLGLCIVPSMQIVHSVWPLAALRAAHQHPEPDVDEIAQLLAPSARSPHVTLVWRQGWLTHVSAVTVAEGQFMQRLAEARNLAQALADVQDSDFDFQSWLPRHFAARAGSWCWGWRY